MCDWVWSLRKKSAVDSVVWGVIKKQVESECVKKKKKNRGQEYEVKLKLAESGLPATLLLLPVSCSDK